MLFNIYKEPVLVRVLHPKRVELYYLIPGPGLNRFYVIWISLLMKKFLLGKGNLVWLLGISATLFERGEG
jgi:hypothetical protein